VRPKNENGGAKAQFRHPFGGQNRSTSRIKNRILLDHDVDTIMLHFRSHFGANWNSRTPLKAKPENPNIELSPARENDCQGFGPSRHTKQSIKNISEILTSFDSFLNHFGSIF
jgi:hypothetical protein